MPESFMNTIFMYLKSINYSKTFKDAFNAIINDPYISPVGRPIDDIKKDVFPKNVTWLDETNKDTKEKIDYYKTILYTSIQGFNGGNFKPFFNALKQGVSLYANNNKPEYSKSKVNHSAEAADRLIDYLDCQASTATVSHQNESEVFAYSLYTSLFFIAKGYICQLYSEIINGLLNDRKEFNSEVLEKYGCSGKPGVQAVYRLADRENPNVIALYEAAELEYYGKGFTNVPNFDKAYHYYKKAVENGKAYNPLAGWALAYMTYYYKNPKKELANAVVPELDAMSEDYRKIIALAHIKLSYECGCPAAANVLAAMIDDESIAPIHKSGLKSKLEYLNIAAQSNYVYAKNNLFLYYFNLSKNTNDNNKRQQLLNEAFSNLKDSADLGEPWAINRYALHLYNDKGDKKGAYKYFVSAHNKHQDWASYNLIEKYYLPATKQNDPSIICENSIDEGMLNELILRCKNSDDNTIVEKFEILSREF